MMQDQTRHGMWFVDRRSVGLCSSNPFNAFEHTRLAAASRDRKQALMLAFRHANHNSVQLIRHRDLT